MSSRPGRNQPCPCGSGKKYKVCCLAKDEAAELEAAREQERFADADLFDEPELDDDEYDDFDEDIHPLEGKAITCVTYTRGFVEKLSDLRRGRGLRVTEWEVPHIPQVVLDAIEEEGLDNVFARHNRLAEGVRKAVAGWGLKLCAKEPKWHSDTVSAILVPEGIDSANVVKTAYYRYNLSLGVGLNKVAGKVFRIGHLGALDEIMIGGVLFGVEMALRDCGVNVVPGSGSGAAAEYFRSTTKASATSRPEPKLKLAS